MAIEKTKKTIWIIVRIAITVCSFGVGGYLLYRFEYFAAAGQIDNIIGVIPFAFALIFSGGITALLWTTHTKRMAPLSVSLAVIVLLSAALFPNAVRGNWWIGSNNAAAANDEPDLSVYTPFAENSKTAKLDEEATLRLYNDLPRIDGATAFYPVYAAFAESVYNKESFSEDKVVCTKTNKAYDKIIAGECDIIFTFEASESQLAAARATGADLHFTEIGKEAFVFLSGKQNPTDEISYQEIRNVYSGKTAKWSTLGWKDGGNIIAFQRPEGSGSQTGLQKIMGDLPIQSPQPLPDKSLIGTNSLMKQISVEWKGVQPALGYSYRFFATAMYTNPDAKILKVDGVEPSSDNIRNGSYPFIFSFYAVTNGEPRGNSKLLIDWILSSQGQELISKTGYTPIKNY